jgi:hypothetical protein
VETDQLAKQVEFAQKSVRLNLRSLLLAVGLAAISLIGTRSRGSAVITCLAGIMIGLEGYSFKVSATQLAQFHLAKPAWLDWAKNFALVAGPVVAATGLWLLFRR